MQYTGDTNYHISAKFKNNGGKLNTWILQLGMCDESVTGTNIVRNTSINMLLFINSNNLCAGRWNDCKSMVIEKKSY